jgi:ribosomal protein L37AE/L43A
MSSQHQKDKKEKEKKANPVCRTCKTNLPYKEHPPSGICSKCQTKIGVVFLIIMVILAGMVFVGLL